MDARAAFCYTWPDMRKGAETTDLHTSVAHRDASVFAFAFDYVYPAWRFS